MPKSAHVTRLACRCCGRLDALARRTHRSRSFYLRESVRSAPERCPPRPLAEVVAERGLDIELHPDAAKSLRALARKARPMAKRITDYLVDTSDGQVEAFWTLPLNSISVGCWGSQPGRPLWRESV